MTRPHLKRLFHLDRFGRRLDESLEEEVNFHLETRIGQLVADGRSIEEAREEALRQFGDREQVVQRCRRIDLEGRRRQIVRDLFFNILQDVRYTFRSLRKSSGFVIVSVLSLAVGIGVNTALFTAIHAVWIAPVPGVVGEDRIVDMVPVINGEEYYWWAYPDFEDVRNADTPFEFLAAWAERSATYGAADGGRRVRTAYVTSDYFQVLGALPVTGRGFLDSEDGGPGQHPVVVVSHDFWQDQLGGRSDILGQSLLLDAIPCTVIGVAPEEFGGARVNMSSLDMWVPLFQHPDAGGDESVFRNREHVSVQVLGRLRPGATVSEARAAVKTVYASLATEYPETNRNRTVKAVTFGRFPAQNRIYDLIAVIGICGLMAVLLLIICGNLAGMALARSVAREQEIGVRLALGSSRVRLVRHLMLEAGILTVIGGGVGIVLAMTAMTRISPMDLNISAPGAAFEPSGWTLALSLLLSFMAAQAFGLLPALRYSRPEMVSALKDDTGGGGRRVGRLQRYTSSFQTGIACLLLLIAALFVRSMERTDERYTGFRSDGMAVADFRTGGTSLGFLDPSAEGYPSMAEGGSALVDRLIESIGSRPGVASVALSTGFPLDRMRAYLSVNPADQPNPDSTGVRVEYTLASEGFFNTIGTPILQGRALRRTDDGTSAPVAVITRSFADRLWPGEDALGRQFLQTGAENQTHAWTVVGVVGNVAASAVTEDLPQMFVPLRQSRSPGFIILVRSNTGTDPAALAGPVHEAIRSVDPGLPVPRLVPARSLVAWATQEQRTGGQVAGGLGLLVLLLAAVGVHGVVALTVANRTREIGIRIAMGADRGTVIRGVLRDALRMTWPGLLTGGLLAIGLAAALRSSLLGLSPVDPIAFLSVGALLLLVIISASLVPALRASGIHPMEALRKG
ncbi:ADOP family duplicated permease [Gemmatimonadota bacterium]